MRRQRLLRFLGLGIVAAGFAYLFVYRVGWGELTATMASFDLRYALPVLVSQTAFHLLGGGALWVLSLGFRRTRLGELLRSYWRCLAIGYWTPATVGEASFAWLVESAGIPLREGLALVTMDKFLTLGATCLFALPALWMGLGPGLHALPGGGTAWRLAALAGGLALLTLFLVLWTRGSMRGARVARAFCEYLRLLDRLARRSPRLVAGNLALTMIRTTVAASVFWWAISGFEVTLEVGFPRFVVLVSAARLLALVIPSPNGLGVFEVALVELVGDGGELSAAVLAGALVARVAALIIVTGGLFAPHRPAPAADGAPE